MATVAVTTTPATLDAGGSEFVTVTNTGTTDVTVARGSQSFVLRPTQARTVYPEGSAVTASVVSGSGQVSTAAQAARVSQQAQYAADPAFTGTYAQVVGLAGTGIDVTGAADSAAAINALLATAGGKVARGIPGASYLISAPLVVPSGAVLDMTGCTVTLAPGANCNMLQNKAAAASVRSVSDAAITSGTATLSSATAAFTSADVGRSVTIAGAASGGYLLVTTILSVTDSQNATLAANAGTTASGAALTLYNRDGNVSVIGGTWARGSNAGSGSGLHSLLFRHIDGLLVRDVRITSSAGKYAVSIGDATKVRVLGLDAATFSDGVHLCGPLAGAVVRDVTGTYGDDIVAITPQDWAAYADSLGDVSDVVIENVEGTTSAAVLNLLGGAAGTLKRVRARNIGGVTTNSSRGGIVIGNDSGQPGTATGTVDDIRVDNLTTRLTNTSNSIVKVNAVSGGQIRLKGITHASSNAVSRIVTIPTGTAVTFLSVEDVSALNNTATDGIWVTGTVNDLVVKNWASSITGYVLRLDDGAAGATVSRVTMTDVHLALPSANGGFIRAQQAGHTLPVVQMANCSSDKSAWLADVGGTVDFNLSGVRMTNNGGIANVRATAVTTFRGDGNSIAKGTNGISVAAGGKAAVLALDIPPATAAGGFPTVAVGAGAGAGATATVTGSDRAGNVSITTGTSPSAAAQATVTFIGTWAQAPKVVIVPTNAAAAAAQLYVSGTTTTGFTVTSGAAPSGNETFTYLVAA